MSRVPWSALERRASFVRSLAVWRFENVELDERMAQLRVDGAPRPIEPVPLGLLRALLDKPGQVATRAELLAAVWRRQPHHLSRNVLSNAVAKLRKVLGEPAGSLIRAVPGKGYLLDAAVERFVPAVGALAGVLAAGRPVPHGAKWWLRDCLSASVDRQVWRAAELEGGGRSVFKFADGAAAVAELRHEEAVARRLHSAMGERPEFVLVRDSRFDVEPSFVEFSDGGIDLLRWSDALGGLAALSLDERLAMAGEVAAVVALAHAHGVLHQDIRPEKILVDDDAQARGRGHFRISLIGFRAERPRFVEASLYRAPEALAGAPAAAAADVYSLGVLLHQFAQGDLKRDLGSETQAPDCHELLSADIADATQFDPVRRLASARELSLRIASLEARRRLRAEMRMNAAEALAARREQERVRAERMRERSEAVHQFLTAELMETASLRAGGDPEIKLIDALLSSAVRAESALEHAPGTLAGVHRALGRSFLSLGDEERAIGHFRRALALHERDEEGVRSDDAIGVSLELVRVLAGGSGRSGSAGRLEAARSQLAEARAALAQNPSPAVQTRIDAHVAAWFIAFFEADWPLAVFEAEHALAVAAAAAGMQPAAFVELRRNHAATLVRAGRVQEGIALLQTLLGEAHPEMTDDHLQIVTARFQLGVMLLLDGRFEAAAPLLVHAHRSFAGLLGAEHLATLDVANWCVRLLEGLERLEDAESLGRETHAAAERLQGTGSEPALAALDALVPVLMRNGRGAEAEAMLRAAIGPLLPRVSMPERPFAVRCLSRWVQLLPQLERIAEARALSSHLQMKHLRQALEDPRLADAMMTHHGAWQALHDRQTVEATRDFESALKILGTLRRPDRSLEAGCRAGWRMSKAGPFVDAAAATDPPNGDNSAEATRAPSTRIVAISNRRR